MNLAVEVERWTGWSPDKQDDVEYPKVWITSKPVKEINSAGRNHWHYLRSIEYKNAYLNIEDSESW